MFKAFNWMVNLDGFKEHLRKLIIIGSVLFLISSFFISHTLTIIKATYNINLTFIIGVLIAILLPAIPNLLISGYFWEITESIIRREEDILPPQVYNEKIKKIEKIELPEFDAWKFIWRGIAAIVANALMWLPMYLIVFSSLLVMFTAVYGFSRTALYNFIMTPGFAGLVIIVFTLAPALLWNYAKQNSIVAVWNIPKAIHIVGNYPLRYFVRIFGIIVVAAIDNTLKIAIGYLTMGLSPFQSVDARFIAQSADISGISLTIYFLIIYLESLYFMYIYAYLLGTVAPPSEADL